MKTIIVLVNLRKMSSYLLILRSYLSCEANFYPKKKTAGD
jgi:hypothetical protein